MYLFRYAGSLSFSVFFRLFFCFVFLCFFFLGGGGVSPRISEREREMVLGLVFVLDVVAASEWGVAIWIYIYIIYIYLINL
jgi:hypothetical protein